MHIKNKNLLVLGGKSFIAYNFLKLYPKDKTFIWTKKDLSKLDYKKASAYIKKNKIEIILNFISDNNNKPNNYNLIESFYSNSFFSLLLIEILLNENYNFKLILFSSFEVNKLKSKRESIYGINKKYIEDIIFYAPEQKKKFIKLVKLNSVLGPGDTNFTRIIPSLIKKIILNKKKKLKINYKYFVRVDYLCNSLLNFINSDNAKLTLKGKRYKILALEKLFRSYNKANSPYKDDFFFKTFIWYKNYLKAISRSSKF